MGLTMKHMAQLAPILLLSLCETLIYGHWRSEAELSYGMVFGLVIMD